MATDAPSPPFALERDGIVVSTDPLLLDLDLVHRFLSEDAYWSRGVERDVVERSIENSIPFGLYGDGSQIGFARVVTDRATFAWVADVFVVAERRGSGGGRLLIEAMLAHPELAGLRRWVLATRDAHELYREYGFESLEEDPRFMALESDLARRACLGEPEAG